MQAAPIRRVARAMLAGAMGVLLIPLGVVAYDGGPVADGGTISGRVRVLGEVTTLPPQPVYKHPEECGKSITDERMVVGADGALQNVVVAVEGIERGKPLPTGPVVIDNHHCAFVPHVLTASLGQTLQLVNKDPFLHDAHAWLGDRTLFNLAIPRGRTVRTQLRDAGLIHVNCNVRHTWMHAYLFVATHPYHTVTGADGRFTLTDVPAGTHHLRVWHEMLGSAERDVVVRPGEIAEVDLGLAAVAPSGTEPPEVP